MTEVRYLEQTEKLYQTYKGISKEPGGQYGIKKASLFEFFTFRATRITIVDTSSENKKTKKVWVSTSSLKEFEKRNEGLKGRKVVLMQNQEKSEIKTPQDMVTYVAKSVIDAQQVKQEKEASQKENDELKHELKSLASLYFDLPTRRDETNLDLQKKHIEHTISAKSMTKKLTQNIEKAHRILKNNQKPTRKDAIVAFLNASFIELFNGFIKETKEEQQHFEKFCASQDTNPKLRLLIDYQKKFPQNEHLDLKLFFKYLSLSEIQNDKALLPEVKEFLNTFFDKENDRFLSSSLSKFKNPDLELASRVEGFLNKWNRLIQKEESDASNDLPPSEILAKRYQELFQEAKEVKEINVQKQARIEIEKITYFEDEDSDFENEVKDKKKELLKKMPFTQKVAISAFLNASFLDLFKLFSRHQDNEKEVLSKLFEIQEAFNQRNYSKYFVLFPLQRSLVSKAQDFFWKFRPDINDGLKNVSYKDVQEFMSSI